MVLRPQYKLSWLTTIWSILRLQDFPASQVDINLLNNLDVPVTLYTVRQVKKSEHSYPLEVGVIEPHTGPCFLPPFIAQWGKNINIVYLIAATPGRA